MCKILYKLQKSSQPLPQPQPLLYILPIFLPNFLAISISRIFVDRPNMCKGLQQQGNTPRFCLGNEQEGGGVSLPAGLVKCELCNSKAVLYCQADDAYLCRKCDKWVHQANFLALRHIRCFLCNTCQNLTQRYLLGASHEVLLPTMVSLSERERRQCISDMETKHSTSLKTPFLFL